MLSSRFAGIPISSSTIDGPGVPQLLNRGEQTMRAVTGSGGRLHFGMVAGIKSERWPTSNRNPWPDCVGIRSPSVIAFSSDYELLLGERKICTDDEQGEHIKKRIASDFIRLSTLQVLDTELARIESGRSRNSWKRLVVVAPPHDAFAVLLGRKWLPEEIIVLADREFVDRLGVTYAALASHPDLSGAGRIGGRLANAAAGGEGRGTGA